jgi:hypothetical protein
MHQRRLSTACLSALIAVLLAASAGAAPPAQTERRCFEATGQCIEGRLLAFWERNNGMRAFGMPIASTTELEIDGRPRLVQWFERSRLELHPENPAPYDVLLGRLGAEIFSRRPSDTGTIPTGMPEAGCRRFPQTGRSVCGSFLQTWRTYGLDLDGQRGTGEAESLALFGLPLTDARVEMLDDGQQHTVQWFERARFELHPENPAPFRVLFGLLGREALASAPAPTPTVVPPTPEPTPTDRPRRPRPWPTRAPIPTSIPPTVPAYP